LVGLNRAFLGLLVAVPPGRAAFGLESPVLARLRTLSGEAQDALAFAPVLLAGCRGLPGEGSGTGPGELRREVRSDGVAEARPPGLAPGAPCQVFATALLTWLWQVSRADPLAAALHTGPVGLLPQWLRQAGYRDIERAAVLAPEWLEARFSANPRLWPDLIRAAAAGDSDLLAVTRLSFVQLALVPPTPLRPATPRPP
jgi:hypothetical protein